MLDQDKVGHDKVGIKEGQTNQGAKTPFSTIRSATTTLPPIFFNRVERFPFYFYPTLPD